jgi:uncharacterized protein YndB with AHSA1/START domain
MATEPKRSVNHQYFIRAPADQVFRAITEPKLLTRWLCDRAELASRKGGAYLLAWKEGPTHTGLVVDFVPGARLALAWRWPGVDLEGTVLALSIEAQKDGTVLHVEHSGFPRSEKWVDLYGGAEWGWTYFAMNLKSVLEQGHDLRSALDG